MKITRKMLKAWEACPDQVDTFASEWPRGAEVTRENVDRAVELGLNVEWLAERVLDGNALAEYERVTAAALAEYDRARDAALAKYDRAAAPAIAEYERVRDAALAEYDREKEEAFLAAVEREKG